MLGGADDVGQGAGDGGNHAWAGAEDAAAVFRWDVVDGEIDRWKLAGVVELRVVCEVSAVVEFVFLFVSKPVGFEVERELLLLLFFCYRHHSEESPSPAKNVHHSFREPPCGNLQVIQNKGEINFKVL